MHKLPIISIDFTCDVLKSVALKSVALLCNPALWNEEKWTQTKLTLRDKKADYKNAHFERSRKLLVLREDEIKLISSGVGLRPALAAHTIQYEVSVWHCMTMFMCTVLYIDWLDCQVTCRFQARQRVTHSGYILSRPVDSWRGGAGEGVAGWGFAVPFDIASSMFFPIYFLLNLTYYNMNSLHWLRLGLEQISKPMQSKRALKIFTFHSIFFYKIIIFCTNLEHLYCSEKDVWFIAIIKRTK